MPPAMMPWIASRFTLGFDASLVAAQQQDARFGRHDFLRCLPSFMPSLFLDDFNSIYHLKSAR